jgi:hypothetical protein
MSLKHSTKKGFSSRELAHQWEKYVEVSTGPNGPLMERLEALLKDGGPEVEKALDGFLSVLMASVAPAKNPA